jgi:serine/threonine-protein kinase
MARGTAASKLPASIGRYDVIGFIATGGMAELFLARDPASTQPVVIKRILPHLARQSHYVNMFVDEARIGSRMRHPNVIDVFELGQTGDDEPFLVMEYLQGENISGLIRRLVSRGERLSYGLAVYVIAQACLGLHAAHALVDEGGKSLEIVHRDVSPQNIFITYDGFVKLLDFGIATAAQRVAQTSTGQLKGKFSYMSPEQCRSEPLDARSDIFSLGVALYELSTCKRLFQRPNELLVLKAVCEEPIARPSRERSLYPPSLEAICMRALERDRELRFATAIDMHRELVGVLQALGLGNDARRVMGDEMLRLFDDRVAEKQAMLENLRTGTQIDALPTVEVDETVEIPLVTHVTPAALKRPRALSDAETRPLPALLEHQTPPTAQPQPAPQVPPERSRARLVAGLVLAFVVVGAGGAILASLLVDRDRGPREPEVIVKMTPVAPATPPAPPAIAPDVVISVVTTPPGARVYVDGVERGRTPIDLPVPRGPGTARVEMRKTGYETASEELVRDRDQQIRVALKRRARAEASDAPASELDAGATALPLPPEEPAEPATPSDASASAPPETEMFDTRR